MTRPLSVVLVGGGRIAVGNAGLARGVSLSHASAIRAVGHAVANLSAVVEPDAMQRTKIAQEVLHVAADLEEVPTGSLEVIVIATPSAIRRQPFEAALERQPSAIVVEKPLSVDFNEARDLIHKASEAKIPIFVNFNRRTDDRIASWMGRLREAGVAAAYIAYGRGMANYASHAVDLVQFGWGPVQSVRWLSGETNGKPGFDPSPSFALTMYNGMTVVFQGFESLDYDLFDLRFRSQSGEVTFLAGGAEILDQKPEVGRYYNGYSHLGEGLRNRAPVSGFEGMYRQLHALLNGESQSDLCSGEDALATAAVLEAVKQSSMQAGAEVRPALWLNAGKE
ncbi:MAG: Gfo/Idh/MocA family oxidoreductase [Alphaproteobacteria bacterium]|nr:Gfo/Idh/MocA family oxidoreductase [Alphaproteobacteria bacterium]